MDPKIEIPSEAPVMVLPGAVLFPDGILPLRIFEPRYRAMLEYALDHDRMFCVALMKPGITEAMTDDQFFHTAGIGLISASVTQADGTSNLMLQGLARVRLAGFVQLSPFRIARVRPLSPVTNDLQETAALAQDLREQCSNIRINGSPLPDSFCEMLDRATETDVLANAVAHALIADSFERQDILEEEDVAARLRMIAGLLRRQFPGT